ncbi:MAG TPA: hypothetical protein VLT92_16490, partial [Burkholderiales bacterium]|nr:hypothetical protein [Burkholderiales bacterium]
QIKNVSPKAQRRKGGKDRNSNPSPEWFLGSSYFLGLSDGLDFSLCPLRSLWLKCVLLYHWRSHENDLS